ncbi:hypothetical protein O6P43_034020 [Quillaja saponaria]|uniref:Uncharacterized protein n=1 Tax=Quillaja saponaria TaxID=32244 RepID=A0AAD7KRG0_QUISA|nr:hypothetical protein O6P43_034020 [Quillaja saponaria]
MEMEEKMSGAVSGEAMERISQRLSSLENLYFLDLLSLDTALFLGRRQYPGYEDPLTLASQTAWYQRIRKLTEVVGKWGNAENAVSKLYCQYEKVVVVSG